MKTALITGATSGIGKELALIHAKKGGNLVLVSRNFTKLQNLKQEIESTYNNNVFILQKDLTDANAAQEVYNEIQIIGVRIDYLINNAGFGGVGKFNERDLTEDLNMIQLNVSTLVALTHLFLQDFVKRKEGKILNVSSTASLMAGPLQATYFATKAFVTSFSNAIWQELKDSEVTVTNLMPGATETNFGKVSGMDKTDMFKKTASAYSVALAGYNAMMNGELNVISGLTFSQKVLLKISDFVPKKIQLKMISKMQQTRE